MEVPLIDKEIDNEKDHKCCGRGHKMISIVGLLYLLCP